MYPDSYSYKRRQQILYRRQQGYKIGMNNSINVILRKSIKNEILKKLIIDDVKNFNFITLTQAQWTTMLYNYFDNEYIFIEFTKYYNQLTSKIQIRGFLKEFPELFNKFTLEIFEQGKLTAKEISWVLGHIIRKNENVVINTELLDWVKQQLFMDLIDGSSKNTNVVSENLKIINKLIDKNANSK